MTAALVLQRALRARLISWPAVTALVPAGSILDSHQRPAPDPAIILGEDQEIAGGDIRRQQTRVYATLHLWKREPSTEGVKEIAGAIRAALHSGRPALGPDWHCVDCWVGATRFLRDPDGETSHGVVTVEALVKRLVP